MPFLIPSYFIVLAKWATGVRFTGLHFVERSACLDLILIIGRASSSAGGTAAAPRQTYVFPVISVLLHAQIWFTMLTSY